jgi:hypothetical protein
MGFGSGGTPDHGHHGNRHCRVGCGAEAEPHANQCRPQGLPGRLPDALCRGSNRWRSGVGLLAEKPREPVRVLPARGEHRGWGTFPGQRTRFESGCNSCCQRGCRDGRGSRNAGEFGGASAGCGTGSRGEPNEADQSAGEPHSSGLSGRLSDALHRCKAGRPGRTRLPGGPCRRPLGGVSTGAWRARYAASRTGRRRSPPSGRRRAGGPGQVAAPGSGDHSVCLRSRLPQLLSKPATRGGSHHRLS